MLLAAQSHRNTSKEQFPTTRHVCFLKPKSRWLVGDLNGSQSGHVASLCSSRFKNWLLGGGFFAPNDVWEMVEDVVPCHQLSTPHLPKSIYRNTAEKAWLSWYYCYFSCGCSQLNQDNIDFEGPMTPWLNPTSPTTALTTKKKHQHQPTSDALATWSCDRVELSPTTTRLWPQGTDPKAQTWS